MRSRRWRSGSFPAAAGRSGAAPVVGRAPRDHPRVRRFRRSAERYGWLNWALAPAELRPFVERLAYQIASFPAEAIALAKEAVAAAERPTLEGLLEEADCFNRAVATPAARTRMARFLEIGGQTEELERDPQGLARRILDKP